MKIPTLLLASALVLTFAPAAFADPPKATLAESLTGPAKDAFDAARNAYGAGDHATAYVKFQQAYEASHDARLLWNMAVCQKSLHHYAKALPLVRRYLAEGSDVIGPQDRADAEGLAKAMEPLTATLAITVDEADAEVAIDGEAIGTSPVQPALVDAGARRITVKKAGFQDYVKDARIDGGAPASLDVKLVRVVHQGRLVVKAPADATIQLDDKVVGKGSFAEAVASGGHTLRVTATGKAPYQSEVLVQDGQTREVGVSLEPEASRGIPLWAWIGGGAVVAGGLAVGGYLLFKPSSTYEGPTGNLPPGIVYSSWRPR